MNENPYAAPTTSSLNLESQSPNSERIRRTYLKHEASVKSIGTLYFLGGLLLGIMMTTILASQVSDTSNTLLITPAFIALAAFQIYVAIGLRKLKSWARIPAIVLAAIGLFAFPIGTLISSYFLYLLCSKSGTMVFSAKYAQIMADTPEIKYRTSVLSWIILALLITFIIGGIIFASKS